MDSQLYANYLGNSCNTFLRTGFLRIPLLAKLFDKGLSMLPLASLHPMDSRGYDGNFTVCYEMCILRTSA